MRAKRNLYDRFDCSSNRENDDHRLMMGSESTVGLARADADMTTSLRVLAADRSDPDPV